MPVFIVISFKPGERHGQALLVDGVDARFAADQGAEGNDVYVVPEDKARLFRDQPRSRGEVAPADRTTPDVKATPQP
jgi:hypothetical protein